MRYVLKYHNVLNDEVSISELFQEAMIGILESLDTFDLSLQTSFTTYSYFHIKKRLIDFIKRNKLVRAPRDIARNMKHVNEAQGQLLSTLGKQPTVFEIIEYLEKNKEITLKPSIVDSILILLDLNSSGHDETFISEYKDQLCCSDDDSLFRKMELRIKNELNIVDEVTKEAAVLRFGIGKDYTHTPEEINLILELERHRLDNI